MKADRGLLFNNWWRLPMQWNIFHKMDTNSLNTFLFQHFSSYVQPMTILLLYWTYELKCWKRKDFYSFQATKMGNTTILFKCVYIFTMSLQHILSVQNSPVLIGLKAPIFMFSTCFFVHKWQHLLESPPVTFPLSPHFYDVIYEWPIKTCSQQHTLMPCR